MESIVLTVFNLHRELSEHRQYQQLLALSPGLEERLNTGTEGDLRYVADMVSISTPFSEPLPS
jgi:hypothetical protein